ncbi:MAG: hypothetical protein E6G28_12755 [Actinobacteria bacterium]|nr:MAG: hypothetical protein E6G28_12755 [Actinomycetota bacterium]
MVAGKARRAIRFFEQHRRLLHSKAHGVVARKTLVRARLRLVRAVRQIATLRRALHAREMLSLKSASPREAICGAFGDNCSEAVDVAWCESRLQTTAQNGEYLGLFQMGTLARHLFGHGSTAWAQATAAHRYFVYSGRDWSPWSCKPPQGY